MVKPLTFKGDPSSSKHKSKKRKLDPDSTSSDIPPSSSTALATIDGTRPAAPTSAAVYPSEDDSWLTPTSPADLSGPIVLVLPTSPPKFLATDTNGTIFAAPVENMVENDPRTAEPSDVRTVWVVGKIPGSDAGAAKRVKRDGVEKGETEDDVMELCFKSCYGNYLSVDGKGGLVAQSVAVGKAETFRVAWTVDEESGRPGFGVSTASSAISPSPTNTADAASTSTPNTTPTQGYISITSSNNTTRIASTAPTPSALLIRMQTRFHAPTVAALKAAAAGGPSASREKISRSELEKQVGRKLSDDEVKRLKRAYRHGTLREEMLVLRVKSGRDKFA